jgi:peroxiredoxin
MAGPARRSSGWISHYHCFMTLLQPEAIAPDFVAQASDGRTYRLHQLLQQSRVLLVFYPGNNTPG